MAVKTRKNYSLDGGIVSEFQKVCMNNGKEYSETVEELMKMYIAKDGQLLMDEMHAPLIEKILDRRLNKLFDQVKGMVYNQSVDIKLIPYLLISLHKHSLENLEQVLDETFVTQILEPERESFADEWEPNQQGIQMLQNATGIAHKQIQEKRQRDIKKREAQQAQ